MPRVYPYEIQVVSRAFSGKIPPHLWKTVGRASTQQGAYRRYAKEYRWYNPDQNSWSGHVRVLYKGQPCYIDRFTHEFRLYDPETGYESDIKEDA